MQRRVAILGGGLAGLAAAAVLAPRGFQVTLLESRPRWGGRASSFVDRTTGETIDNCQHVSLGCCTNFSHFCRSVGIDDLFHREPLLWFVAPDGRINRFGAVALPAPLHLLPAFLGLSYLCLGEKIRLGLGLRSLARRPAAAAPQAFSDWLQQHAQTPQIIDGFWNVVLVSALSESLERIDTGHARKVFVDSFLAHRDGWQVLLPTAPLDQLYGDRITNWLSRHGVECRLQAGGRCVVVEDGRAVRLELRGGEAVEADDFVLAVPQHLVLPLLPDDLHTHPLLSTIDRLETAPISSVHLWFDRPIMMLRHAALVGRLSQWVFNRTLIQGGTPTGEPGGETGGEHSYQVVISASRDVVDRPQEETIQRVLDELAGIWPETATARLLHSRLVTEHKAVISMTPGVDALRPPQQSPLPNLQLAGDWTRTGWPSTMEGAVRSGYLAAENILRRHGINESLIQDDLPRSWMYRTFFLGSSG